MKAKVLQFCREEGLFSPGEQVICCVSGGADSMAMLWCLHSLKETLNISLCVAHFNHCLRGEASEKDEKAVKKFCTQLELPCFCGRGDVNAYSMEKGKSIEEAARELRYEFFAGLPGDKLATAHHADDNAETVLLNLLRGSGLRGLSGIPPKRGRIVRPFLSVTREEIRTYLEKEGIPWREDASNGEDNCLRNRLRHHVLPLLQEEMPSLSSKLMGQSALLRREDAWLDRQGAVLLEQAAMEDGSYNCQVLRQGEPVLRDRALRLLLREYFPKDVSQAHIEAAGKLLYSEQPGARLSLPGGLVLERSYERFRVTRPKEEGCIPETPLHLPGTTELPGLNLCVICRFTENFEKNRNTPFQFAIKYDMIAQSAVWVRSRREGDRILLGGHHKSLKKLLIEKRIPKAQRQAVPVITNGAEILAVAGIGVSDTCRVRTGDSAMIFDIEKKET